MKKCCVWVRYHEQFSLCGSFESSISFLIRWRQLAGLVLQLLQLLQLRHAAETKTPHISARELVAMHSGIALCHAVNLNLIDRYRKHTPRVGNTSEHGSTDDLWLMGTLRAEKFVPVHVADLVMQCQEGHGWVYGLTTLSTQTHHLQPCLMDLLG